MATSETITPTQSEKINFFRVCRIILDNVPQVLRFTFFDTYKKMHGRDWIKADGKILRQTISCTNNRQKDLLDEGDPTEWDPTLLCLILLHKNWKGVLTSDEILAISNLRDIRNEHFAHSPETNISSTDFAKILSEIEKAYGTLLKGKANESLIITSMKQLATGAIIDESIIGRFEECRHQHADLMKDVKQLSEHGDNEIMILKKELQGQSERIQHQEESSYHLDQRLSCLEEKHEEQMQDFEERVTKLKHERVTGLENKMSSMTVGQRKELSSVCEDRSDSPVTPSSVSSQSQRKSKKHRPKAKIVGAGDSDTDSGVSTSVSDTFDTLAASGSKQISSSISISNPPDDNMGQSSAVRHFTAHAVSSPPVVENQHSDVLLPSETTCLQEVGQQDSGKPKIPQSPIDGSLNQAMFASGLKPGVFVGPEQIKLKLAEVQQRLDETVQEKKELEQELDRRIHEDRHKQSPPNATNVHEHKKKICDLEEKLRIKTVEIAKCEKEKEEWKSMCLAQWDMLAVMSKNLDMKEKEKEDLKLDQKMDTSNSREWYLNHTTLSQYRHLGGGTFGNVYEVTLMNKKYAAKEFNQVYDATECTHRRSEFDLLPKLKHDNIVSYVGVQNCIPGQRPILIMELMCCSLHTHITEETKLINLDIKRPNVKVKVAHDILCGLDYLHSYQPKIIHRDLTAKNVLLDPTGMAKIADFGNSRLLKADQLSSMTRGPGTLAYMAPELQMKRYDEKVDIFSFGHLLLFIFIDEFPGQLPPPTTTSGEKLIAVSEIDRRGEYIKMLEQFCTKLNLQVVVKVVKECLSNLPKYRPSAVNLTERLRSLHSDN